MATVYVSTIQHRFGSSTELPDALEHSEIGFIEDTGELVIGAPNNPLVLNRQQGLSNIFPYQNIRILTEFSDLSTYFNYNPVIDSANPLNMSFILIGDDTVTSVTVGSVLTINGVNVALTTVGTTLNDAITAINGSAVVGINAFNSDGKIGIINTSGNDLIMSNHTGTPLLDLKISANATETYPNIGTLYRTISDRLDDNISIKSFGSTGLSTQSSGNIFNSSFLSLYGEGTSTIKHKDLKVPSGTYLVEDNSINLIKNLTLSGEGIDKTVITGDVSVLLNIMDTLGNNKSSPDFGSGDLPDNILIRDITFKNLSDDIVFLFSDITNIVFERCKFIGTGNSGSILVKSAPTTVQNTNLCFDKCIFENAEYGLDIQHDINGLVISNCVFKDITNEAIYVDGNGIDIPTNVNITNNTFVNVGDISNSCIFLGDALYSNIKNNMFEDIVSPYKVIALNKYCVMDVEETVTNIASTFNPEVLELDIENVSVFLDYCIYGIDQNRKGSIGLYIDSAIPDSDPIILNDSNPDVDSIFSATKTTDGFKILLLNAGAENINLKYTYRIV